MYLLRVLIIGDTNVGKTSLLLRFNENNFVFNQKTTIGVDYKAKEIVIDDEKVKLQIWDTAGQERFRSMTSAFYNRAQGVVLTFDVSQRSSFLSLDNWIADVLREAPKGCVLILCANKTDYSVDRMEVKREEYIHYATERNLLLFETSASTGVNVHAMFEELGRQIISRSRYDNSELKQQQSIDDTREGSLVLFDLNPKEGKEKKRKCC